MPGMWHAVRSVQHVRTTLIVIALLGADLAITPVRIAERYCGSLSPDEEFAGGGAG